MQWVFVNGFRFHEVLIKLKNEFVDKTRHS